MFVNSGVGQTGAPAGIGCDSNALPAKQTKKAKAGRAIGQINALEITGFTWWNFFQSDTPKST